MTPDHIRKITVSYMLFYGFDFVLQWMAESCYVPRMRTRYHYKEKGNRLLRTTTTTHNTKFFQNLLEEPQIHHCLKQNCNNSALFFFKSR